MTREAHKELMMNMFMKSEEEINEMFNSGMFNKIVLGAVRITLESLSYRDDDIKKVLYEMEHGTFDTRTAGECRAAAKRTS